MPVAYGISFFLKPIATISVNGAQEGKKLPAYFKILQILFRYPRFNFFAQTINITGFKNCQKNDDFWWLKIPTGGHIPTEVAAVPLRATGDR